MNNEPAPKTIRVIGQKYDGSPRDEQMVGLSLAVLLAACATPQATPTSTPVPPTLTATPIPATATPLPTPAPATTAFPTGTFVSGDATWEFKTDGTNVWRSARFSELGNHTVTGNHFVLKMDFYGNCGDDEAIYTWTYDGEVLSFKILRDACPSRNEYVFRTNWTRKP